MIVANSARWYEWVNPQTDRYLLSPCFAARQKQNKKGLSLSRLSISAGRMPVRMSSASSMDEAVMALVRLSRPVRLLGRKSSSPSQSRGLRVLWAGLVEL